MVIHKYKKVFFVDNDVLKVLPLVDLVIAMFIGI